MKYTTKKQVEQEVEITLPCYVKYSENYTKIFNEKECLIVKKYDHHFGVSIIDLSCIDPFGNDGWEFITEEEFDSVYEGVLTKVNSFQPQLNEQPA